MITEIDEGKGLIKTYWSKVRNRIAKVEPVFANIVDELDPDKNFPLYLAYYPYGVIEGDTKSPILPKLDSGFYRLDDVSAPKDVIKHLGYGKNSAPLGMLLDKCFEVFIDLKDENITIPWMIYTPGSIFPFSRILSKKKRVYAPNGVLTSSSGARSVFMLPNIGCSTNHINLQRDFNIQNSPPKSLYEHWFIFKKIANSHVVNCNWRSCIIFFSEQWIKKLHNDPGWYKLKLYLHELAWHSFEYERSRIYYDFVFSVIQKKRNLKPNPYLVDTAKHLFMTALGAVPGYTPTHNDDLLPMDLLQKTFVESYGLKKYYPTIMQPWHFELEKDNDPIYYSLQNPTTLIFSPKSRKISSTLFELRELEHIMRIFIDALSNEDELCADTIINTIAKTVEFSYFHNKSDRHKIIKTSSEISKTDKRFSLIDSKYKIPNATFASDSPFVRGCVRIKVKPD